MSKRENHWYLINNVVRALGRGANPGGVTVGVWLFLVVVFVAAYKVGALDWLQQNANSPLAVIGAGVGLTLLLVAVGLVMARVRQNGFRGSYWKALASPTPEPLLRLAEQAAATMKAMPDGDALGAHERVMACALYGDEPRAAAALAGIDWKSRAPLIQAIGSSSEAVRVLLCRRDARRFLELTRLARAQASVSAMVPGAAQTERYFNTCVAMGEALLDLGAPKNLKWLEESAADDRFPALQLLASLGLAVALERSGDTARASQLRDFLRQAAPHCAPLHLKAEDFIEGATQSAPPADEGRTAPLASGNTDSGNVQERAAKQRLFKLLGLWGLLLVLYAAFYVFFSASK